MITKEAYNRTNCSNHRFFFNSARTGMELLLRRLFVNSADILLVPAYIGESEKEGSGVFDPVRHTGIAYQFYAIGEDFFVNMVDFCQKLDQPGVRAVLLIHYFGVPQRDLFLIKELCASRNILIIEDCAHTLSSKLNGQRLGEIGDFGFYSLHKSIPSLNAGYVQINNPVFYDLLHEDDENISREDLLLYAKADREAAKRIRRANWRLYESLLSQNSTIVRPVYPSLGEDVTPLNYPIFVENYDRFQLYNELIEKGVITVSLYYRLIAEIDMSVFPISAKLSSSILNLPLHQDTLPEDIEFICNTLNKWLK